MSTRINPPVFGNGKNYERFKQELLAWREITDLSREKQGIAVALTLPENDVSQIREKVFDQLSLDELKNGDGLVVLINFLDKHLAKDDLTDSLEKFEEFEDFKRLEGQSINEFVAMFDSKYRKIEKKNMGLPSEILAFKLLRKANISKEERLLVLTGMNYENRTTLYEEAKKSLKKFKGNEVESTFQQATIKLEPAFLAANEEALLAAGYSKTRGGYQGTYRSYRENGWNQGKFGKPYMRENQRGKFYTEKKRMVKNINPQGPDGKPLTCRSCGSFRHLLHACPDSWENMKRVNTVEKEHAVLFTGYDTNEIRRFGVDARNCAVLDSACSSTVCGSTWMDNYIESLDLSDREKVMQSKGQRVFTFGGGTCLKSKGEFRIPAVVAGKTVTITTDVVESDIPLLLSRTAMKKAAIKMDLENDSAIIMGQEVALNLTTSGHYCIPIDKTVEVPVEQVYAVNLEDLITQKRNNPNIPNVMSDNIPALPGSTSSEMFAKHLNVLHATQRANIQSETDERVRIALRNKVRVSEQAFEHGDQVFYKREGRERWLGPGKVVFQDGKVVFVRHGAVFVRVSPNRLQKVNHFLDIGDDYEKEKVGTDTEERSAQPEINDTSDFPAFSEDLPARRINDLQTVPVQMPMAVLDRERMTQAMRQDRKILRANDNIQYKIPDTDVRIEAKVLGRAGKVMGKNKHWYNIMEDTSKEKKSNNLEQVDWELLTDNVNLVLKNSDVNVNVSEAKHTELQKLKQFNTYEEIKDRGQTTLSTRWVITTKTDQTKARLVVRGFEQEFAIQSDSPTVGKGTLRIFLTLASNNCWIVKTTDIKSAFLQGQEIKRDVYKKPPKESENATGVVWKFRHGWYGLKDGARQFYLSLKDEILRLGCQISKMNPAMFVLHKNGKLSGVICCHVDDFLHAGDECLERIITNLQKRFVAGKIEERNFDYIGFRVIQQPGEIFLDQSRYVENMRSHSLNTKQLQKKEELLTEEEQSTYRQIIGQINWVVHGTRPDMTFELIDLSTKLKQGTVGDLSRAVKVVNILKDVRSTLVFQKLSRNVSVWRIMIFTDASLCNKSNGTGSTAAFVVWLADDKGNCCPLDWHTNKRKRVVRLTIAAEALSLQEGLECGYYYRQMLEDIMRLQRNTIPIVAYVDNKSVIDAVHSTKLIDDKRLRVDIAAISESLFRNEVQEIRWCPGRYHLADCMTKQGASGYNLLEVYHGGRYGEKFI